MKAQDIQIPKGVIYSIGEDLERAVKTVFFFGACANILGEDFSESGPILDTGIVPDENPVVPDKSAIQAIGIDSKS